MVKPDSDLQRRLQRKLSVLDYIIDAHDHAVDRKPILLPSQCVIK